MREVRERDERIRALDEVLTRANRLSALGELAASIAHEIKNPLIAIQGFARKVEDSDNPDNIKRYGGLYRAASPRGCPTVLARLLDFSRMSTPVREKLDVNVVLDDTILFIEHHLTRFRNIALTVEKTESLPNVYADKIHIQQAMVNIMMNAAQAMPEGGPHRRAHRDEAARSRLGIGDRCRRRDCTRAHREDIRPLLYDKREGAGDGSGPVPDQEAGRGKRRRHRGGELTRPGQHVPDTARRERVRRRGTGAPGLDLPSPPCLWYPKSIFSVQERCIR